MVVLFSFSLYCYYMQPAIVTTDALSEGYVIVVKVIPEKTSLRAVCTNGHSRSQLSTKLVQNLDYGCAGQVSNLTVLSGTLHCARLLDLEPDKELSDRISPIAWNCINSARQLEECHVDIDRRLGSPTYLS